MTAIEFITISSANLQKPRQSAQDLVSTVFGNTPIDVRYKVILCLFRYGLNELFQKMEGVSQSYILPMDVVRWYIASTIDMNNSNAPLEVYMLGTESEGKTDPFLVVLNALFTEDVASLCYTLYSQLLTVKNV